MIKTAEIFRTQEIKSQDFFHIESIIHIKDFHKINNRKMNIETEMR